METWEERRHFRVYVRYRGLWVVEIDRDGPYFLVLRTPSGPSLYGDRQLDRVEDFIRKETGVIPWWSPEPERTGDWFEHIKIGF